MTGNADKYKCSCCGGDINRATMICEYCGTRYKEDRAGVIRIETFRNPVRTLENQLVLSDRYMMINNPQEYSEYAIRTLARQFAECIAPFMEVEYSYEPSMQTTKLRARIKVIEPIHRSTDMFEGLGGME